MGEPWEKIDVFDLNSAITLGIKETKEHIDFEYDPDVIQEFPGRYEERKL